MRISATLMLVLVCALCSALSCSSLRPARSGLADAGGALWAAALSCESCGRECASACGTRHFRACCFNYLRRKRPDGARPQLQPAQLKLQLWLAKTSEQLRWHHTPSPDAAELLQLLAGSAVDQPPGLEQSSAEPAMEQSPSPDGTLHLVYDA